MLCGLFLNPGQYVGFVPTLQPADPEPVCPHCVVTLASLVGRCPVCGVQLVGDEQGRAPSHRDCVGVNMPLRPVR
jgi:predicted amidophosphoribosyltransferase